MEMINMFKKKKDLHPRIETEITVKRSDLSVLKNLDRIFEMKYSGLAHFGGKLLSSIARELDIVQGIFLIYDTAEKPPVLKFLSGYACNLPDPRSIRFKAGEGLPGQALKDKKILNLKNIPEGYMRIKTGLGEAFPGSLLLIPLTEMDKDYGVIELASFRNFSEEEVEVFRKLLGKITGKLKELQEL